MIDDIESEMQPYLMGVLTFPGFAPQVPTAIAPTVPACVPDVRQPRSWCAITAWPRALCPPARAAS